MKKLILSLIIGAMLIGAGIGVVLTILGFIIKPLDTALFQKLDGELQKLKTELLRSVTRKTAF